MIISVEGNSNLNILVFCVLIFHLIVLIFHLIVLMMDSDEEVTRQTHHIFVKREHDVKLVCNRDWNSHSQP